MAQNNNDNVLFQFLDGSNIAGVSTYDMWRQIIKPDGTPEEFLEYMSSDMPGPIGPAGLKGPTGAQGKVGPTGAAGTVSGTYSFTKSYLTHNFNI